MTQRNQMITLRIELLEISPTIWRRMRVPADIDLATLHYVFQIAMGWTDSHLHLFQFGDTEYQSDMEEDGDLSYEAGITLQSVLNDATEFGYQYDFGDN